MNPSRWIDRMLFALLLVASLQIPVLGDQYRQYLAGYIDGLDAQVEQWQQLASEFGFESVDGLIAHLQTNSDPVVAKDTQSKKDTLAELAEKRRGLDILSSGHYLNKVAYMFAPQHFSTLNKVMANYQPGLPLTTDGVAYSIVLAILLDMLLLAPVWVVKRKRKGRYQLSH